MRTSNEVTCHCGQPIFYHPGLHPNGKMCLKNGCSELHFTRELCEHCDSARCDAFPDACGRTETVVFPTIYDELVGKFGRDPHEAYIEAQQISAKLDSKMGEIVIGLKANIYNQSRIPLPSEDRKFNGPHYRALKALGQRVQEITNVS